MTDTSPAKAGGKGRPTPKRPTKKSTRPSSAPTTRKEAYRARKDELRRVREAQKSALRAGDERAFPAFVKGPEKAVVRDAVDARSSVAWLIYPAFLLNLTSFVMPTQALRAQVGLFAFMLMIWVVLDCVLAVRAVGKALTTHFPDGTKDRRRALYRYGIARTIQFRKRRMPAPRVFPSNKKPVN